MKIKTLYIFLVIVTMLNAQDNIKAYNAASYSNVNLVYDANVTKVNPIETVGSNNADSNISATNILSKRKNIVPDIKVFNNGSSVRKYKIPKEALIPNECVEKSGVDFGASIDSNNTKIVYIAKRQIYSFDRKKTFLLDQNLSDRKILQTNCVEVWKNGSNVKTEEGGLFCGECASKFTIGLATTHYEDNGTKYYIPNNAAIAESFSHMETVDKSAALIQNMYSSSALASGVTASNLNNKDTEKILNDKNDTKEAQVVKLARGVVEKAFLTQIRQKTIQCFMKRELVPRFYCPIPGKENGAQTGGTVEDDLTRAKERCNSYCKSSSYPCKSVDTGEQKDVSVPGALSLNLETPTMSEKIININDKLLLKKIEYIVDMSFENKDSNSSQFDTNNTKVSIPLRIEYIPKNQTAYVKYAGEIRLNLESLHNTILLPEIPNAQTIKLQFFSPKIEENSNNYDKSLSEIIHSISIGSFRVSYYDNKYYFCGNNQIVPTPSQCLHGETLEIKSGEDTFLVCNSEERIHGPEPRYGAYYTQESCSASCIEQRECVETFAQFANDAKSPRAYKTTIGCVDDPENNTACSIEACKNKFQDNSLMPIQEVVYDGRNGTRTTVTGGLQVEGVSRPRVSYSAEKNATSKEEYEKVFLDESKDQAYKNMISDKTFNYSKNKLSIGQPSESACRVEKSSYISGTEFDGDKSIFWKLKPNSKDIGSRNAYNLYKIAVVEQVYKPISGMFRNNNYLKAKSLPLYKDYVFMYITPSGLKPFYLKEYNEVYQEGNASKGEVVGWTGNSQHNDNRYISYDNSSEKYLVASGAELAKKSEQVIFKGNKNYYEYMMVQNMKSYFKNHNGGSLQSQIMTVDENTLPEKKYSVTSNDSKTEGSIINYSFYGMYSDKALTNAEIVDMIENDGKKYLVYKASKGSANKTEIYGDGTVGNNIKIFIKGSVNDMTLSADIKPKIQDEGKDVVMFMFTYEE